MSRGVRPLKVAARQHPAKHPGHDAGHANLGLCIAGLGHVGEVRLFPIGAAADRKEHRSDLDLHDKLHFFVFVGRGKTTFAPPPERIYVSYTIS